MAASRRKVGRGRERMGRDIVSVAGAERRIEAERDQAPVPWRSLGREATLRGRANRASTVRVDRKGHDR
ncbi:hypothetical protein GCM10008965_18030 [Methylorubrum aminovorans]